MTLSSIGDLARSFTLRNQVTQLKADLERRSQEVTTGRIGDIGRAVKGDFTPLTALDATLAQLDAFKSVTAEAKLSTQAMQSALASVSDMSGKLGSALLAVTGPGNPTSVDAVAKDALAQFRSAVAIFNTRVADRSLFGGTETRSPALASADVILDAVVAAAASATTAQGVATAVKAWFADPAGYATIAYTGGPALDPLTVAQGEAVPLDATAADPGVRDTLMGLALAAILDKGTLAGNAAQRAELAKTAGAVLLEAADARGALAARIGTAEERIANATTRNSTEATALQIARLGIVSVDPYDAATALTEAESQLDTLYTVTARLSRLSLANYL
jgi:flagellar hook-associated protein 3 FlgL